MSYLYGMPGGGYGFNPYQQAMAAPWGPPAFQQLSPNQQAALTQGMGSRAYYGPNSPTAALQQQMQRQAQMQMQPPPMTASPAVMPPPMTASPAVMPRNPSIGLSDIVRQMQGGLSPIAARQQLGALAGVPQMGPGIGSAQPQFRPAAPVGQWSSQAQAPRPFSPLANEGYRPPTAPGLAPQVPNAFTAQNQTRGMSGGMSMGRPTFGAGPIRTTGHLR